MPLQAVPFGERASGLRGAMDWLTGRMPGFLLGARTGRCLPVFSFDQVTLPSLEPYLVYLMENGYRTLGAEEVAAVAKGERALGDPSVMLQFEGGWGSLWTVVAPLLRRYGMRAVAYVIPGRLGETESPRPVWGEPGHDPAIDHSGNPFCSWRELGELANEGRVDVQSNSWSHAEIFCSDQFRRLILPETVMPLLAWPVISDPGEPIQRLSSSNVFHPLLPVRSRLSDAFKHDVDPSVVRRIHDDPNAAPYLFRQHFTQVETEEDRAEAIRYELERSRGELETRLKTTVSQVCFPRGVCGSVAGGMVSNLGYESAFADRLGGFRAVVPGQDPHRLMRLPHRFIPCLPGRPRKVAWRVGNGRV